MGIIVTAVSAGVGAAPGPGREPPGPPSAAGPPGGAVASGSAASAGATKGPAARTDPGSPSTATRVATPSRPAGLPGSPSSEASAPLERYRRWAKDWRAQRDIHRKARLKRLRYRLDRTLRGQPIPAAVRTELDLHARRMAQLYRIKEVAVEQGDDRTIHRADALILTEAERHDRAMGARKESGKRAEPAATGARP